MSGVAIAVKALRAGVQIYGVQSEAAPVDETQLRRRRVAGSRSGGHHRRRHCPQATRPNSPNPSSRSWWSGIELVSEAEIEAAVYRAAGDRQDADGRGRCRRLCGHSSRPVSGSDATRTVVVILCGANIDMNILDRIIERSLLQQHRLVRLRITISDRPGGLANLLELVAEQKANILHIHQNRVFTEAAFWEVDAELILETRNREHIDRLLDALHEADYPHIEEIDRRIIPSPRSRSLTGRLLAPRTREEIDPKRSLIAILRSAGGPGDSACTRKSQSAAKSAPSRSRWQSNRHHRGHQGADYPAARWQLHGHDRPGRHVSYRRPQRRRPGQGGASRGPPGDPSREAAPPDADTLEQLIWSKMRQCFDPEIPVNIVDLGLIYDCQILQQPDSGYRVEIKMTLTAPGCGMGPVLAEDVRSRIDDIPGVRETAVEVVFDPPWNPNMMTEAARLQLGFM